VTVLQAGLPGILLLPEASDFSLLCNVEWPWGPLNLLFSGYEGFFPTL